MSTKLTAALTATLVLTAAPAFADPVSLDAPMQGASLQSGLVDMTIYYTAAEDEFEVVAGYSVRGIDPETKWLRMGLEDGDRTSFALPNNNGIVFHFGRSGDTVSVAAERVKSKLVLAMN